MGGGAQRNEGASLTGGGDMAWGMGGMWARGVDNLHKRVVDRNHEHLTGVLQRRVVDVSGHVGAGACRACGSGGFTRQLQAQQVHGGVPRLWEYLEAY
jgi:hypothetical protein